MCLGIWYLFLLGRGMKNEIIFFTFTFYPINTRKILFLRHYISLKPTYSTLMCVLFILNSVLISIGYFHLDDRKLRLKPTKNKIFSPKFISFPAI